MASTDGEQWVGEEPADAAPASVRVLLYSDHVETRAAVRTAVGERVAADLPRLEWQEVATMTAAVEAVEAGGLRLLVLDGEAGKAGGMGLTRQLKDEIYGCPPVVLLVARPQDAWLASWSEADAVVTRPLDPFTLQDVVATLLRSSLAPTQNR
jgi:DNA-binding response OmpR family regulator